MYLRERIAGLPSGRFVEVGPGSGEITCLFLQRGCSGQSFDLDAGAVSNLSQRCASEIEQNRFIAVNSDFLATPAPTATERVDMVISCMVMEHMDKAAEIAYMQASKGWLKETGLMLSLVPASPAHWGIEDEIAGHYRRYTAASIQALIQENGWHLRHIAELTFPTSNLLLTISNYLVNKSERSKLGLSTLERTKQSGSRKVLFKTQFPTLLQVVLNRHTLYPLNLLQKACSKSERALVLYFEASPGSTGVVGFENGN